MKATLRVIGRGAGLILLLIVVLPGVLAGIALARRWQKQHWQDMMVQSWSKLLLRTLGLQLRHYGTAAENPVFLVANHVSWLDIPVIHSAKTAGFVAKAEIARWPVLGWVVKCGDTVFHQRGRVDSRQRVLQALQARLEQNRAVAVFPEGKTTDGSAIGRFHRQLLQAAVETGCPIQPVAIEYWDNQHRRHWQVPFQQGESFLHNVWRLLTLPPGFAVVHWLSPLPTRQADEQPRSARELAQQAQRAIEQQLTQDGYWLS